MNYLLSWLAVVPSVVTLCISCGANSSSTREELSASGGHAGSSGSPGSASGGHAGSSGSPGIAGSVHLESSTAGAAGQSAVPPEQPSVNEYGFDIRLPQLHTMPCPGSYVTTRTQPDTDWLCTFAYGGTAGYLYVQATPISCRYGSYKAIFELESRAWLSVAGEVHQLANAVYDWGGGHHIDTVTFEWEQRKFTYGHSSLRYARTCQSMDCVNISSVDGTLTENGCTNERRLPVACVPILSDGTHRPLVDTFAPCVNNPETSCTQSGGTVEVGKCCDYTYQYPNTCMPATASCDPSFNCTTCNCPAGSCFNGSECRALDAN